MIIIIWIAIVSYAVNIAVLALALGSQDDTTKDIVINTIWSIFWPVFYLVMLFWVAGEHIYWWIYNRKNNENVNESGNKATPKGKS